MPMHRQHIFEFCNLIGVHCTVHADTAMYYVLPDPFLIF